ncbi:MAG: hypothetical protein WED34_10885 [Planctomycetales bacterium]
MARHPTSTTNAPVTATPTAPPTDMALANTPLAMACSRFGNHLPIVIVVHGK